ncbi:MAG: hypothetical protein M0R51_16955 [Clostridia bacterium]|jgi:hypothetical protein|nr:hypothetical protein [Clostridia bacterium]
MTWKKRIESLFATGVFSITEKLMMILYYWILGKITDADAEELAEECDYTFTKPTTTGVTIFTNGTTTYTIVTLITAYHDNDYAKSMIVPEQIIDMIDAIYTAGYITAEEQTALKGLGWNN